MELRRPPGLISIAVAVSLGLSLAAPPRAAADALPDATERVMGLARVWAKAKYFHPYLAYKDIDWDAALLSAIPKAEAAKTVAEYRAAVQGMLATLGDPLTRVMDPRPETPPSPPPTEWLTEPSPGVLEVKLAGITGGGFDLSAIQAKGAQVAAAAAKAKVMIIDVRGSQGTSFVLDPILGVLPAIDEWPLQRTLQHHGFRTQIGVTSGGYFSTFVTTGAQPPKPGPKVGPAHVVWVLGLATGVPEVALGLQAAGRATIVSIGPLDENNAVASAEVELPGDLTANLRLGELLWGPPAADVVVGPKEDASARARTIAKGLVAAAPKAKPRKLLSLPVLRPRDDPDYADAPYPSRERRMLAGVRAWAVLEYFFPYRYLIADWDAALRDALPKLAAAADRDGYLRALRQLTVRAGDGHINVFPIAPLPGAKPRGMPGVAVRFVEGKLAVTRVIDPAAAKQAGIAAGDVVETIDGKPVAQLLAEARLVTSGSTDEARDQRIADGVLFGDDGSTANLGVRGADAKPRTVTLPRTSANLAAMFADAPGPHFRKLAGDIGYADLTQLVFPEVAPMFEAFKGTRAIVFDLRGYPNGTAWAISPRINTRKAKYGAQFLKPLVSGLANEEQDQRVQFLQAIPELAKDAWLYTGKIVVLIDDRAISQAEHSCLFFEEAAGATFIGSPTHGANGDVTRLRMPGGLQMMFTGQEVRHADGRQLQRIGVQPHVLVRPTIAGVRAGKDEVLDRALAWLGAGAPAAPKPAAPKPAAPKP